MTVRDPTTMAAIPTALYLKIILFLPVNVVVMSVSFHPISEYSRFEIVNKLVWKALLTHQGYGFSLFASIGGPPDAPAIIRTRGAPTAKATRRACAAICPDSFQRANQRLAIRSISTASRSIW